MKFHFRRHVRLRSKMKKKFLSVGLYTSQKRLGLEVKVLVLILHGLEKSLVLITSLVVIIIFLSAIERCLIEEELCSLKYTQRHFTYETSAV